MRKDSKSKEARRAVAERSPSPKKRRRTAKQERAEDLKRDTGFLSMHRARCTVCKHPLLKDIEAAYLDGTPMVDIAAAYGFKTYEPISSHVRALRLITLREAKAARSSQEFAQHILRLHRFDENHLPSKEIVLKAMTMWHEAEMATLPKKVHLSGAVEIKDKLIPLGQDIARNILIRMGFTRAEVEKLMPHAVMDGISQHGLVKEPKLEADA